MSRTNGSLAGYCLSTQLLLLKCVRTSCALNRLLCAINENRNQNDQCHKKLHRAEILLTAHLWPGGTFSLQQTGAVQYQALSSYQCRHCSFVEASRWFC